MLHWLHQVIQNMAALVFEVTAAALLLMTTSAQPSPFCPRGKGDCTDVRFFLWTSRNPVEPQQVTASNLSSSNFAKQDPTKLVVHGYSSGMNLPQLAAIRKEYLLHGSYNLIYPMYLELADSPCYIDAVLNVDYVGKCIANFVRAIDVPRRPSSSRNSSSASSSYEILDLHLIGFSLGAQTTAFAANHLRPEFRIDRISGLDPALPLFYSSDKDSKLSADDAEFVDVLHTNAFIQGQASRCGHVDFYMNGGLEQPGCRAGAAGEAFFKRLFAEFQCDHHRSPEYFSESIRSAEGFWGWSCSSIEDYQMGRCPPEGEGVLAGAWVDRRSEGFHAVTTTAKSPFARGRWWLQTADGGGSGGTGPRPTVTLAP